MRREGTLSVLTYHRLAGPGQGPPGIVSTTPQGFARQMRWLARSGRAVGLADVLAARTGGAPLRRGAVLVTFDDAYTDFRDVAWPVLRAHGIRPVLFVPTGYPDTDARFWWDRLHAAVLRGPAALRTPLGTLVFTGDDERLTAYRTLREHVKTLPHEDAMALVDDLATQAGVDVDPAARVLGWDALRALGAAGVDLAPHTRTHPRLDRLPDHALREEIAGSIEDLRREAGSSAPAFAYPSGGVSDAAAAMVAEAGIPLAFSTRRGVNDLAAADPLRLDRINVGRRTNVAVLRAQLALPPRGAAAAARPVPPPGQTPVVAYMMSRFPKISETFILTELLAMERRGVRVETYPLLRERATLVHPEAQAVVDRAHYQPAISPAVLASQLHWLRRDPQAYLGALRDVITGTFGSLNFMVGGIGIFPKAAHMARLMQRDGVTHVHCHFATHPAVAGLIIHRLTGLPFSFTGHGSDLHVERRMLPEKVAEAAFVATVSEYNRRLIIDECGGRFADKVHIIRAGVDTSRFDAARGGDRPPQDGPLRIVCVGTLHEVKGQGHLVEACRLLTQRGIPVRCRFIGDGEDREALEARIAEGGLTGSVELLGAATGPEVAAQLRDAHVLVAPSVPTSGGKREGIPVVLMEGMSTGLPVVSSRLSGIPELVVDGVAGLLTEPGDAEAIADALARLHADPELRRRLGEQGRRRVEAEFDVERSIDRLLEHMGATAAAAASGDDVAGMAA
ncbi:glycosyltransferase [Baekduia soli]|uniref:Glycosyltransferase n=1 Tax=Baekduia soli TaxID=496014 RepID=A0A5B8U7Z4_9ACTN|nr:glycosyltransferase [Baekduia soli]QEC49140.1 glycosyltransferase [Baekduia soli]